MIIKIFPDKEKVKSILKMTEDREKFLSAIDAGRFATIAAENYYEIIKELATAVFLVEGFKAVGEYAHKETIDHLSNYKEFESWEIEVMNDLRIKRNKSSYEGKQIEPAYLENKKELLAKIIIKLKSLLSKKLI
ncbi:MAG TPA: hypothetical protein VJA86_01170 [Candidatus Nanoarchaeia archaeon]|nr:hypothetical protein [Candidatus Nanoarchaeia archaeon]